MTMKYFFDFYISYRSESLIEAKVSGLKVTKSGFKSRLVQPGTHGRVVQPENGQSRASVITAWRTSTSRTIRKNGRAAIA